MTTALLLALLTVILAAIAFGCICYCAVARCSCGDWHTTDEEEKECALNKPPTQEQIP